MQPWAIKRWKRQASGACNPPCTAIAVLMQILFKQLPQYVCVSFGCSSSNKLFDRPFAGLSKMGLPCLDRVLQRAVAVIEQLLPGTQDTYLGLALQVQGRRPGAREAGGLHAAMAQAAPAHARLHLWSGGHHRARLRGEHLRLTTASVSSSAHLCQLHVLIGPLLEIKSLLHDCCAHFAMHRGALMASRLGAC